MQLTLEAADRPSISIAVRLRSGSEGTHQVGKNTGVVLTVLVSPARLWVAEATTQGEVTVSRSSVSGRFNGLEPARGGAEGRMDGTFEVRCA